ncbi:MAG: hypothetical protein ABIJ74_03250 [archaeon]
MKGFYSVLIGVLVVFVLATALFTVSSFNKSQSLIPQKEGFGTTVKKWQNTQRVLDKASSDAIIDSGFASICLTSLSGFNPDTNIYSYDYNMLALMKSDCIIKNFSVSKTGPATSSGTGWQRNVYDVNVRLDLKCIQSIVIGNDINSLISYDKNVLFEKTVDANYNSVTTDCNIFVIDKQSNMIDVNAFAKIS